MTEDAHGFSIYHDIFPRDEMARIVDAIERSGVARSKAGARHLLHVPDVRTLASHPRLLDIARRSIGSTAFPFRATLFDKSPSRNWLVAWHQDTALPVVALGDNAQWGPWSTKSGVVHAIAPAPALQRIIALRVHLDDSTDANGPLRVLPETHTRGVLEQKTIHGLADTITRVECVTSAGGVVAMRPLVVHASSKVRVDLRRRVVHIEYAPSIHLDENIELAVG
jgi:ectoine hydroxylase-related dioxygenase (phytanoyl-CoA dioxygenase family)